MHTEILLKSVINKAVIDEANELDAGKRYPVDNALDIVKNVQNRASIYLSDFGKKRGIQ